MVVRTLRSASAQPWLAKGVVARACLGQACHRQSAVRSQAEIATTADRDRRRGSLVQIASRPPPRSSIRPRPFALPEARRHRPQGLGPAKRKASGRRDRAAPSTGCLAPTSAPGLAEQSANGTTPPADRLGLACEVAARLARARLNAILSSPSRGTVMATRLDRPKAPSSSPCRHRLGLCPELVLGDDRPSSPSPPAAQHGMRARPAPL